MTDELIQRIRAVDPLPGGSTAPPFELVYAALQTVPRRRARHWGRRALRGMAPAIVIAMSVGVLVVAVVLVHVRAHTHGHARVAVSGRHRSTTKPAATPVIPNGGMAGHVTVWGAGFNVRGAGVISLEQCLGCQADGNETAKSTVQDWLATTADAGRSWKLSSTDYYVQDPLLSGHDGWAGGLVLPRPESGAGPASQEAGSGIARYLRTGDSGRSWTVAPSAAPNEGGSDTSLADGDVWAFGLGYHPTILHTPVTGARLSATVSQPLINGYDTNTHVAGAGAGTAYVINANLPRQSYVTHDDGRSWQTLTQPPCTGPNVYADLYAASGQTVWLTCSNSHDPMPTLVRSLDGGQSWTRLTIKLGKVPPQTLVAASPRDAWMLTADQKLLRTTDAGSTWQPVWSATDSAVSPLSRPITQLVTDPLPILSVESASSASIVTLLNRGTTRAQAKLTNLVVYHTTDGGQSWSPSVVPLGPSG